MSTENLEMIILRVDFFSSVHFTHYKINCFSSMRFVDGFVCLVLFCFYFSGADSQSVAAIVAGTVGVATAAAAVFALISLIN